MVLIKLAKFVPLGLFLLVQVYLFAFKNIDVQDTFPYLNEVPLPLTEENKNTAQEFRTPGQLARIDIMMANYKIKPKGGTFRLSIFKKNHRLFLKNYPANTVEDNRFYTFEIDKIIPAGNYRLRIDYFPQDKKEKLAAWTSKKDLYPYGNLFVNGKQIQGDMTFRVYYHSTILKERNRWLRSGFGGTAMAGGFILILILLNWIFYYFVNKLVLQSNSND